MPIDPIRADALTLDPDVRADRIDQTAFRLAAPRPHASGGTVYQMALAVPGVMPYPELGFDELTPPETLKAWAGEKGASPLAGTPLMDQPDRHWPGVDPTNLAPLKIGTLLDAWWDDAQEVVLADVVVDIDRGLQKIAAGITGVSPQYRPMVAKESGDYRGKRYTRVQRGRSAPNHVLLTPSPRGVVTGIRADALGGRMDWEKLRKLLFDDAGKVRADAMEEGASPVEWLLSTLMGMCTSAQADAESWKAKHADAEERMKGMIPKPTEEGAAAPEGEDMGAHADALQLAADLEVQVDRSKRLPDLRRAILAKLAPDTRADSLDDKALAVVLAAAAKAAQAVPRADAWDRANPTQPTHVGPSLTFPTGA